MLKTDEKHYEETTTLEVKEASVETPIEVTATKPEPKNDFDDGGEMELLNDLKKKTDKDVEKTATVTHTETPGGESTSTVTTTEVKRSSTIHYANHQLVAKLTVAALSVGMGIVLQMVSDDWSEEGEKKYTLSSARKAEILEPLELVLEQSKSKYNPVVVLVITVILAYVPMIVTAMRARKAKAARKKVAKGADKVADEAEEVTDIFEIKEPVIKKKPVQSVTVTQSRLSPEDIKRIQKIKSKRGNRSQADKDFINEKGLSGLI